MNKYLSNIGYQGPNTLFILIILALFFLKPNTSITLYIVVLLWQFASHLLNVFIKNILKFPRPDTYDNDKNGDEFEKIKNSITWKNCLIIHRNFGMPSGHAQAVMSELTFIALYFQNTLLTTAAALQVALTLYQRYNKRRHSTKQLVTGSALGILVGIIFYKGIKMYKI
jgi:membrane-associated phospholipid phosphatase